MAGAPGRGVVVLPTGAGKTWVACLAIDDKRRSTLVVAPTLDLVRQWYDVLRTTFGVPVGVIGGGEYDVLPLTVTTYDSAHLHMEHLGDRFGLVVFDECHHLPGPAYALAARACVAPFRLGLTATPERADGRDADLRRAGRADRLPQGHRRAVRAATSPPYETVRLTVELGPEERRAHDEARGIYRDFLARNGIRMSQPDGLVRLHHPLARAATTAGARWPRTGGSARSRSRRRPSWTTSSLLLDRHARRSRAAVHAGQRDRATRSRGGSCSRSSPTRRACASAARSSPAWPTGGYGAVVTSKVLNEGVDIPDANVAIVVSGSASVREHVQRLGRVLRARDGKRALLYELVTAGTTETFTSARRRDHSAYR